MEERLTDLEIHVAHLESTVQELNGVVFHQQQAIDRLEGDLKRLREQLLEIAPSPVKRLEDEEPPPHW